MPWREVGLAQRANIAALSGSEDVNNDDFVTAAGAKLVSFNVDNSGYHQPRALTPYRYTYDSGGTYVGINGGATGDGENYPWFDSEIQYWTGNTKKATLSFRHIADYVPHNSSTRVESKCRSVWKDFVHHVTSDSDFAVGTFTVLIGTTTLSNSYWGATEPVSGSGANAYHRIEDYYGGSQVAYDVKVTNSASGVVFEQTVTLQPINTKTVIHGGGKS